MVDVFADYVLGGRLESDLRDSSITVRDVAYEERVRIEVALPEAELPGFEVRLAELTGGRAERGDAAETKRAQGRQDQRHGARDVAERVAAFVAVRRGIRQRADSDAVEDNDDGSGGRGHALVSGEGVIEHLVDGCDRGGRVAGAVKPP